MTWITLLFGSGGAAALTAAVLTGAAGPIASPINEEATIREGQYQGPQTHVARAGDGLFYVNVLINGQPIRFLVDTGASVTILTPRDALRVGAVATGSTAVQLRTASGHGTMRWAELKRISIGGQELQRIDAAIGDGHLPVSLLGQNVLTKLGSVQISGNELQLN